MGVKGRIKLMNKLTVFTGTDCSGKGTQTKLMYQRLLSEGEKVAMFSYPMYDTPTGKIVGGPYLGKSHISEGYFPQGAAKVDPYVASHYYAADRLAHKPVIDDHLYKGFKVLLDRYVESSMGHQGGNFQTPEERRAFYEWVERFEFGLNELHKPDSTVFLYMPYEQAYQLKSKRLNESPDQLEMNEEHLRNAENAFLELADLYKFKKIHCAPGGIIRTPEDIHEEVYHIIGRGK